HDHFEETIAVIDLIGPSGTETITLAGPTSVDVWFETREGEALDETDQFGTAGANGLDEVMTKMTQLDLTGTSSLGPIQVSLNPDLETIGVIEEKVNNSPGTLDLPPFTSVGSANSFFDVFFQITLPDGTVVENLAPKRISSIIFEKPPEPGAVYESPTTIPLFLEDGTPTEYSLGPTRHIPRDHFVERDVFEETFAQMELIAPNGTVELVQLVGPTVVDVWFERREGEALDDDAIPDGLEEVMTHMVEMDLRGNSSMGPIRVTLNEDTPTTGEIEERVNNTPGILDVQPFASSGAAVSIFDVFFDI
ncbi:MAG: hypothetical protein GY708_21645, partial [Actinomycetia bacterium]|nr:hypothetical protein [Actinomycetes bacterium]